MATTTAVEAVELEVRELVRRRGIDPFLDRAAVQTVEFTANEVMYATDFQPTDLVVVDGNSWERDSSGKITSSGGRLRVWLDGTPQDEDLAARRFAYSLPGGGFRVPEHECQRGSLA